MNKSGRTLSAKAAVALAVVAVAAVVGWQVYEGCIAHPPADMTKLAPAFTTASPDIHDLVQKAVAAGKARDYAAAVEALATIVDKGGLSPEQKQALIFTLTEIRRKVAEASRPDMNLLNRIDELILALID